MSNIPSHFPDSVIPEDITVILRCLRADLPQPNPQGVGAYRWCYDTKELFIDNGNENVLVSVPMDMADYVIETKTGLSGTNYNNGWYRKYKSGWVEQGFTTVPPNGNWNVYTLPIPFINITYSAVCSTGPGNTAPTETYSRLGNWRAKTTATISLATFATIGATAPGSTVRVNWEFKGMTA